MATAEDQMLKGRETKHMWADFFCNACMWPPQERLSHIH